MLSRGIRGSMVSKEVVDSPAHTIYVILLILVYFWFVDTS